MTKAKQKLALEKLRFGSIDARFEVTSRAADSIATQHFKTSFVEPIDISLDDFINGEQFIIYGQKGTGKTSFLKYLEIQIKQKKCLSKFITFSSDVSSSERNKIVNFAGIDVYQQNVEIESGEKSISDYNVVEVWIVFILRQIAVILDSNKSEFETHKNITVFCDLMKKFYDKDGEKGILAWLTNTLKTGKYKIKAKFVEADLKGTAKEKDKDKDFPISYIIEQAQRFLSNLSMIGNKGIYIFFDELNLSFASRAIHKRDVILIRDLLVAIDRLNQYFADQKLPLFVVAGARSDVLHAISAPTHEINKILTGRGKEIRWYGLSGGENPPIMELLAKKITASETIHRAPVSSNPIGDYFRREIFAQNIDQFVVEHTWCNPRDLALLFGEAVKQAQPYENFIGDDVIRRVFGWFSSAVWKERAEELSVEYAPQEVQALKKVLLDFRQYFKISQLDAHWKTMAESDQILMQMYKKYQLSKVTEDLYRIGVIGTSTPEPNEKSKSFTQHWLYRGDNTFDSKAWLFVHKALWPELRLGRLGSRY